MEDKIIEIARFTHAAEAEMLADLLRSEGIECYVRDGISSGVMLGSVDIGGAKVDLLQKDALRALEIMKDHNYEISEEFLEIIISENAENDGAIAGYDNIEDDESEGSEIEQDNDEDVNNKAKLSKQMTIIIVLLAILFGLLVFLNKYYNG